MDNVCFGMVLAVNLFGCILFGDLVIGALGAGFIWFG